MNYYRLPVTSEGLEYVNDLEKVPGGAVLVNELGVIVKKVTMDGKVYLIELFDSILADGELMSELTPLQIELFWKIAKNKLRRYADKHQGERGRILSQSADAPEQPSSI